MRTATTSRGGHGAGAGHRRAATGEARQRAPQPGRERNERHEKFNDGKGVENRGEQNRCCYLSGSCSLLTGSCPWISFA